MLQGHLTTRIQKEVQLLRQLSVKHYLWLPLCMLCACSESQNIDCYLYRVLVVPTAKVYDFYVNNISANPMLLLPSTISFFSVSFSVPAPTKLRSCAPGRLSCTATKRLCTCTSASRCSAYTPVCDSTTTTTAGGGRWRLPSMQGRLL